MARQRGWRFFTLKVIGVYLLALSMGSCEPLNVQVTEGNVDKIIRGCLTNGIHKKACIKEALSSNARGLADIRTYLESNSFSCNRRGETTRCMLKYIETMYGIFDRNTYTTSYYDITIDLYFDSVRSILIIFEAKGSRGDYYPPREVSD